MNSAFAKGYLTPFCFDADRLIVAGLDHLGRVEETVFAEVDVLRGIVHHHAEVQLPGPGNLHSISE